MRRYTENDAFDGWHYEAEVANTPDGKLLHERPRAHLRREQRAIRPDRRHAREEVGGTVSTLLVWAERLEQTPLGSALAESRYAFPVIEGIHLVGLSVAVGMLFIADLRLAGVLLKRVPPLRLLQQLRPWILGGFAFIFLSGGLLFLAEASLLVGNPAFVLKLLFIVLAGANAAYFELVLMRKRPPHAAILPANMRYAAIASLTLWSLVIVFGRLIPYMPRWT